MNSASWRPVAEEEAVAPVTILDELGRVVRIVPAEEFRRTHGVPELSKAEKWRRKRARLKAPDLEQGALETVA